MRYPIFSLNYLSKNSINNEGVVVRDKMRYIYYLSGLLKGMYAVKIRTGK